MKVQHKRLDWRAGALGIAFIALSATLFRLMLTLPTDTFRHILVIDITQSMNVIDSAIEGEPVTRLDYAKHAAAAALETLPCGSMTGIGIFTGHRSLLLIAPVEVCAHFSELTQMLDTVDWRMAWTAKSEVSKGVFSALKVLEQVGENATLVFLTDGHEAPPLSAEHPPRFPGEPGASRGVLIGVGGLQPAPIPKLDPEGNMLGYFGADEVMQIDVFSAGRNTSVAGESMVGAGGDSNAARIARGTEHLSSLKESHLKRLASSLQLDYARSEAPETLADVINDSALANRIPAQTDLRFVAGLIALFALCVVYARRA